VLGQVWLWNPKHARRGNINLGFGFQAPSGNDHVTKQRAHVAHRHGSDEHRGVLRHSAWQRRLGHNLPMAGLQTCWQQCLYTNGNYAATQGGNHGVLRSATALNQPLTAFVATEDQYLLQGGYGTSGVEDYGPDHHLRTALVGRACQGT
jgi:hypothetical protein